MSGREYLLLLSILATPYGLKRLPTYKLWNHKCNESINVLNRNDKFYTIPKRLEISFLFHLCSVRHKYFTLYRFILINLCILVKKPDWNYKRILKRVFWLITISAGHTFLIRKSYFYTLSQGKYIMWILSVKIKFKTVDFWQSFHLEIIRHMI